MQVAGMQVAGTKALVADGTRPAATKDGTRSAAENKTAPDCPAEQSALQYCVARWRLAAKSCSAANDTQANWHAARSLAVESRSAAA